jgi:uroporphyrinogen decarboxylase
MTARENVLRVLACDEPEYVPGGLPLRGLSYLGSNHESYDGTGGDGAAAGSTWFDIWGVGWHKELEGVMGMPQHNPLADITRVDSYPFPSPYDPRICERIAAGPGEYDREQQFLCGHHRDTLFEQAYMLVGMENLFVAFHEEPNAVRTLFHHIIDFHLGLAEQYVARGVEWASMGDDLGHQQGLLFSPDIMAEFFLPEYHRLLGFYEARGVRVNFHSCGRVQDLAETFIALGVDVLNPVQATANDLPVLRARTQRRVTLMGGVPSHVVLEGPVARIRAEVKEKIGLLGREGGYICTPDQGLPFPPEHLKAFAEAVEEFGRYPLPD